MPITILSPQQPAAQRLPAAADLDSDSDSDGGADIQEDSIGDEILTPGTVITSNPQWMR
jgi:exosome complex component RRP4